MPISPLPPRQPTMSSKFSRPKTNESNCTSRPALFAWLGADLQRRSPAATLAMGEHRNQGSQGIRHPLYDSQAAPFTVNTLPEGTFKALADHGDLSEIMSADGGDCEAVLGEFAAAGVVINDLAAKLQSESAPPRSELGMARCQTRAARLERDFAQHCVHRGTSEGKDARSPDLERLLAAARFRVAAIG